MDVKKITVTFIGAGNAATCLAKAFYNSGIKINQVYSRKIFNAKKLASKINASPVSNYSKISSGSDLYIVSIPDSAIEKLPHDLYVGKKMIAHTSGSLSIEVLKKQSVNYGVFYPVQSFKKNDPVVLKGVPVCVEGSNKTTERFLIALGMRITGIVYPLNSIQRRQVHLAAVFANNFTNALYCISEQILLKKRLGRQILQPLIENTAMRLRRNNSRNLQTGPAIRHDKKIINLHLNMLNSKPEFKKVYKIITKLIQQNFSKSLIH